MFANSKVVVQDTVKIVRRFKHDSTIKPNCGLTREKLVFQDCHAAIFVSLAENIVVTLGQWGNSGAFQLYASLGELLRMGDDTGYHMFN